MTSVRESPQRVVKRPLAATTQDALALARRHRLPMARCWAPGLLQSLVSLTHDFPPFSACWVSLCFGHDHSFGHVSSQWPGAASGFL